MLFQDCCLYTPFNRQEQWRNTKGPTPPGILSLVTGSFPHATTSMAVLSTATLEDFVGTAHPLWGDAASCILARPWGKKTPYRVKYGLSLILRKVCVPLTLPPSDPDHTPVGIGARHPNYKILSTRARYL